MPRLKPLQLLLLCVLSTAGCAGLPDRRAGEPAAPPAHPAAQGLPVTAQGMHQLGRQYEGQRRHVEAIAAYRQALRRDPLLVEAYTGLGTSLAALERYEEAARQFEAAAVLAPGAAHALNNLGFAYLLSGNHERAIRALEEAQRLDPGHEKSRENLRLARLASPQPQAAAEPKAPATAADPRLVELSPHVFELRPAAAVPGVEARPVLEVPPAQGTTRVAVKGPQAPIASTSSYRLEVSNGNGITGLAKRVAAWLARPGLPASRLTNQLPFAQAATEIQYRDGYAAQATALAGRLAAPARVVQSSALAPHVDVRLVLGKDAATQTALLEPTVTAGLGSAAAR